MKWPTKTDSCENVTARERERDRKRRGQGAEPVTNEGKGHIYAPGQQCDTFSVSYSSMSLSVSCPAHAIASPPPPPPTIALPVPSQRLTEQRLEAVCLSLDIYGKNAKLMTCDVKLSQKNVPN